MRVVDQKLYRNGEVKEGNPWDALKKELGGLNGESSHPEWIGYFGYEMGCAADVDCEMHYTPAKTPDLLLKRYSLLIAFDHQTGEEELVVRRELSQEEKQILDAAFSAKEQKESITQLRSKECESKDSYLQKIVQIQEKIREGDVYQVNLSQQMVFCGEHDPFSLFCALHKKNPAPFSAYIQNKEFSIISSSPERLLEKRGDTLEARPIKGTMPRGKDKKEDREQKEKLSSSEKEKAELLMITDLMRNDLGRVSVPGSVEVLELFRLESYTNVHHLHSVVKAKSDKDKHPVEILRACFPGGSISGCPKLSAMQFITEMEERPRGVYTGSIGYFSPNGDFDFNIAIRTLISSGDEIEVQLGGAIVIDSNPELEWEETFHKGETLLHILRGEEK